MSSFVERTCLWTGCGKFVKTKLGSKYGVCPECRHVTCFTCKAVHEGISCRTFKSFEEPPPLAHNEELSAPVAGVVPTDTLTRQECFTETQKPAEATLPCCACETEKLQIQIAEMRPCLHLVCLTCVEEGARQSPTYLVRCPAKDPDGRRCQSYVNDSLLKRVLSDEMYLSHKSLMGLALQSCATEDCTGKFSIRHDMKTAKCLDCQKVNCIPCKAIHENKTCEEFLQELVARLDGVPLQNLNYDDDDDDSRNEKIACATAGCDGIGHSLPGNERAVWCSRCKQVTCLLCKRIHTADICPHAEGDSSDADENDQELQEGQRARPMVLDPRKTWQAFLRHSERTETRRPKKKIKSSFLRMQGPQGPPGPRGARGPPGANITRDEMFREFKGLLREVAERRVQLMAVETECKNDTNCSAMAVDGVAQDSTMPWVPHLLEIDRASLLPRTQSSFFWELSQDVRARRGKELRVHPFHRPFSEGSFERGPGLNATRGLFKAPISGLYLFFGRVFVVRSLSPRDMMKQLGRRSDDVGLLVCTDSLCHKNLSLRTSKAFSEGRRKLTMTVNGPLMLRAGHQVSLWLWNRTPQSLTLQQGSQFSGFLVSL